MKDNTFCDICVLPFACFFQDELDERFKEIAECNFTGYLGFNGTREQGAFEPANRVRAAKEIELCAKYNLRCVPSLCGVKPPPTISTENTASTNTVEMASPSCIELGVGSEHFWGWQLACENATSTVYHEPAREH